MEEVAVERKNEESPVPEPEKESPEEAVEPVVVELNDGCQFIGHCLAKSLQASHPGIRGTLEVRLEELNGLIRKQEEKMAAEAERTESVAFLAVTPAGDKLSLCLQDVEGTLTLQTDYLGVLSIPYLSIASFYRKGVDPSQLDKLQKDITKKASRAAVRSFKDLAVFNNFVGVINDLKARDESTVFPVAYEYLEPEDYDEYDRDVGVLQSSIPLVEMPWLIYDTNKGSQVVYFEMNIVDRGDKGYIGVGLGMDSIRNANRHVGWEFDGYGYHGDDGCKFHDNGAGTAYGPKYSVEVCHGVDPLHGIPTVGCIVHLDTKDVYYTVNGMLQQKAFTIEENRTPLNSLKITVGMHSVEETVWVNTGDSKFVFDIENYASTL